MREPKSRLDEMNSIILSVANKNGSRLDLSRLPDSRLKLPENLLNAVPSSFKDETAEPTLTHGLDYFSPGKTAVIMGGKNHVLNYIAAKNTAPGGLVINCFADTGDLEESQAVFKELPGQPLAGLRFHYTPNGDLGMRYSQLEKFLDENPVDKIAGYLQLETYIADLRRSNPLIEDNSVDIVALDGPNFNIAAAALPDLAAHVYRILKKGGVFLFSLLLADEKAAEQGYLCENDMDEFTHSLKFHGLQWLGRSELPYRVISGKEIRYYNFAAFKGKEGPCRERKQAVIYNGPWREVKDDDGHTFPRGKRVAVCDKTFNVLLRAPYKDRFTYLHPYIDIPPEQAKPFPCAAGILFRHPGETKGVVDMNPNPDNQDCCTPEDAAADCCAPGDDGGTCC